METNETLKPVTDYLDSFYEEGIPYQIKIDVVTFLMLIIIVIAPIIIYYSIKSFKK